MENKYITVAYKLYVMEAGKPELVEEATAEHPFSSSLDWVQLLNVLKMKSPR